MRKVNFAILICAISASVFGEGIVRPAVWQDIKNIVVVILENTNYEDALKEPFLKEFANGGALLKDSHAVTRPSQPNYIAFISGDTQGLLTNTSYTFDAPHLGDLLDKGSKSWKVYAEGYPGGGFLGDKYGRYARKHVPFLSFKNVQNNPTRLAKVVDLWEFFSDHKNNTRPNFSMIIPDLDNDGHDTGVGRASLSTKIYLSSLMNDAEAMKNTLLIITFDEDNGFTWNNDIYTAFYGAGVRVGAKSKEKYNHYNVLRTIEEIFQLGTLGLNDKNAKPILDIWQDA